MYLLRGPPCAFNSANITYFLSILPSNTDSSQAEVNSFSNLNIFKPFHLLVVPWQGAHETGHAALAQHAPYHISG